MFWFCCLRICVVLKSWAKYMFLVSSSIEHGIFSRQFAVSDQKFVSCDCQLEESSIRKYIYIYKSQLNTSLNSMLYYIDFSKQSYFLFKLQINFFNVMLLYVSMLVVFYPWFDKSFKLFYQIIDTTKVKIRFR